jgi:hypothetical protein
LLFANQQVYVINGVCYRSVCAACNSLCCCCLHLPALLTHTGTGTSAAVGIAAGSAPALIVGGVVFGTFVVVNVMRNKGKPTPGAPDDAEPMAYAKVE